MTRNLGSYVKYQVFLNYPFDDDFIGLSEAMSFSVVAAGLIPICAHDITAPDRPRLSMLVEAIELCQYSVHDLSRFRGEGDHNFSRMNMPIEMGMALFHALRTQRHQHRCCVFVSNTSEYKSFASDLAGLDPKVHDNNDEKVLREMYDWLRGVHPSTRSSAIPTIAVLDQYKLFKSQKARVRSASVSASHGETRELMYSICAKEGWWDWRNFRAGQDEFPIIPVVFNE